jgi:DNA-binding NarL/FixJ family response regulator
MTSGARSIGAQQDLVEREAELERLDDQLHAAQAGRGSTLFILGEPGVGKTRLVAEAGRRGNDIGIEVLRARGGELEQQLPFGIVRQLFEARVSGETPATRDLLFEGAAGLARPVFDLPESGRRGAGEDPPFAILHGLHWLAANLAAQTPLALLIDDAHWADRASRRWIEYLARRIDSLPVLVVVAVRSTERGAEDDPLDALAASWPSSVVRPRPFTASGSARLVRARWPDSEDAFCDACHDFSGGNAFLLTELVDELARRRVAPRAGSVEQVRRLGPESVSQAVVARLARLPPPGTAVARAVAVLSAGADVAGVARLTGLEQPQVARAGDALTAAGILGENRPLDFVHPLVRRAIHSAIPPSDRALLHLRAARLLAAAGGSVEETATHLLNAEPEAASWVVELLRKAAARAVERGAPDLAVAYLRRALAEPPADFERAAVLAELGRSELQAGQLVGGDRGREGESPAVEHLREAVELTEDLGKRAEASILLGDALWARDRFREAADAFDAAVRDVRGHDRELELRLEGHVAAAARLTLSAWPLVAGRLDRFLEVEGRTPAERLVAGVLAVDRAIAGEPPELVAELAERAVSGGRLPGGRAGAHTAVFAANALLWTDRLERADELLEQLESDARAQGSVRSLSIASCWRSTIAYRRGRLRDADTEARTSLEVASVRGWGGMPATWAFLLDALTAQGDLTAAGEALERSGLGEEVTDYGAWSFFLHSRARLRLALGDAESAIADLRAAGRRLEQWGARNPSVVPWRSSLAEALEAVGERDEAVRLAAEEVAAARQVGLRRALGIALCAEARITPGDRGMRLLSEAVAALEASPGRLELARVLYELGRAHRRAGRRAAAREPLRRSMVLAHRCGAARLAQQARSELVAAGWRPDPLRASPFDALSATERRVAELVARGLSDREIAQSLFVTERTVAERVDDAMRKVHATSRDELADRYRGRAASEEGARDSYPAGLTPREVEVLRLVAKGLSNPEVAAELVLSPRTVHAHLRSVYRKLDVHSRSAAARSAAELGLTSRG